MNSCYWSFMRLKNNPLNRSVKKCRKKLISESYIQRLSVSTLPFAFLKNYLMFVRCYVQVLKKMCLGAFIIYGRGCGGRKFRELLSLGGRGLANFLLAYFFGGAIFFKTPPPLPAINYEHSLIISCYHQI